METPFEKIVVAFDTVYDTRNESLWDNEPYIIDFNKESKNGIFPFEAHPKSSAGEDWWITQGFEITQQNKEKYLKAIKYVIEEDLGNLTPYDDYIYNIEVADYHTYFIHKSGVWVGDITIIGGGLEQDTLYNYKTWTGL